jgi:hypothetical protein
LISVPFITKIIIIFWGVIVKNLIRFVVFTTALLVSVTAFSAILPVVKPAKSAIPIKPVTPVKKEDRHGVEISIGKDNTGIDFDVYNKVRFLIGQAIADNVVDRFLIYGYITEGATEGATEGGFSGCVQDKPSTAIPSKEFEAFIKKLNAIQTKSGTTYAVNRIKNCPALAVAIKKPLTVLVAKLDGSFSCDESSGIPLTDMQTEFSDNEISVYSSKKQSDGLPTAAECDMQTSIHNVYEIAKDDLDLALGLGYTTWAEIKATSKLILEEAAKKK